MSTGGGGNQPVTATKKEVQFMVINVNGRQFEITPAIQARAESLLVPLTEISTLKVTSVNATMSREKNQFQVNLVLNCKYHTLTATAEDFDLYKALDAAAGKLEAQCMDLKEKIQDHRPAPAAE